MALGNSSYSGGGPLYFLTPRSRDKDKHDVPPHFEIAHGDGEKIVKEDRTVTSVSGDLFRLEFKQHEYEGNITEEAVFYLRDKGAGEDGESYRVPIRFNLPGRSLFNSFASLAEGNDFNNLQIDYYRSKKGYDSFALKQNGEKVSWKFKIEELPAAVEIKHPTTGKVVQRDFSPVNALLKEWLVKIAAKVNKASATNARAEPVKEEAPEVEQNEKNKDDSIPF